MEELSHDRLIRIFVGEQTPETQPFLVQQALLEHASEYFTKAFRHENLGDYAEPGTLRFPEDNLAAWKVFLHWSITRSLPAQEELIPFVGTTLDHLLAVRCWVLGDKYCVPLFQDLIMLDLLRALEKRSTTREIIKEAVSNTSPGSKLRELMAEEVIFKVRKGDSKFDDLDMFDGIPGFISVVVRKSEGTDGMKAFSGRVPRVIGDKWCSSVRWRAYMVAEAPKQHWVYDGEPVVEGPVTT